MSPASKRRVALVVLGDFGRSPRMQYHALALADTGLEVDAVGYAGSPPFRSVREHPSIHLHMLRPRLRTPEDTLRAIALMLAALRICHQSAELLWLLALRLPKPDFILVQNPPAIPTLIVALLAARSRSATLVIDWHNFGSSMLALQMRESNPILRLARWYERNAGQRADRHLCVSEAMRSELSQHWGIHGAKVLYDQPAAHFAPLSADARRDLFRRIGASLQLPEDGHRLPALIVYPSSWTADEDIAIVLDGAAGCDDLIARNDRVYPGSPFPDLLIVLTGNGPLRKSYEGKIANLKLAKVQLRTLWLTPEDYPLMLGAADLGLCCHRSASGFDLPMKLADLMGAGLPVLALDYGPCLAERLHDGENGLLFRSAEELAHQLYELFLGYPEAPRLERLRDNLRRSRPAQWSDGWRAAAAPIFTAPR